MAASSSASRTVVTSEAYSWACNGRLRRGCGLCGMVSLVDDDLRLALRLADAADAITLPRFRAADLRVRAKPDRSPVTAADTACETGLPVPSAAERPADAGL